MLSVCSVMNWNHASCLLPKHNTNGTTLLASSLSPLLTGLVLTSHAGFVYKNSLLSKEKLCSAEGIWVAVFSCSNVPASFHVSSTLPLTMLTKPQVTSLCFCKLYPIKSCKPHSAVGRAVPYGLTKWPEGMCAHPYLNIWNASANQKHAKWFLLKTFYQWSGILKLLLTCFPLVRSTIC